MKSEKLMDYIGQIDDSLIMEADVSLEVFKPARRPWIKWVSAAAVIALCLIAAVPFMLDRTQPAKSGDTQGLPKLTANAGPEGAGYEGFLAFDIGELSNGNPWNENEVIETLPVFQNPVSYDESWNPTGGLTADEMIEKAEHTAAVLGLTVDRVSTNPSEEMIQKTKEKDPTAPIPGIYEAEADCGDVTITVGPSGNIRIFFENGVSLPGQYNFIYGSTTEEQARDVIQYLLSQYPEVVDMKSPAPDLSGGYDINAQRDFCFSAYENDGDIVDRIMGYNFNRVQFFPNEGKLWFIDRISWDLSQKMGDYPIITADEARELLLQKHFITSVPEELPGGEYIARVELVYRTGREDTVFMPYYKFLVELPDMQRDNGLKDFGVFYVPAVKAEYLENMP